MDDTDIHTLSLLGIVADEAHSDVLLQLLEPHTTCHTALLVQQQHSLFKACMRNL